MTCCEYLVRFTNKKPCFFLKTGINGSGYTQLLARHDLSVKLTEEINFIFFNLLN